MRRGGAACVDLSGLSGVGKSSLVRELRRSMLRDTLFAAGKCDQLVAGAPFEVFALAMRMLLGTVMALPQRTVNKYGHTITFYCATTADVTLTIHGCWFLPCPSLTSLPRSLSISPSAESERMLSLLSRTKAVCCVTHSLS